MYASHSILNLAKCKYHSDVEMVYLLALYCIASETKWNKDNSRESRCKARQQIFDCTGLIVPKKWHACPDGRAD